MRIRRTTTLAMLALLASACSSAPRDGIAPDQAHRYIGEKITVCGMIVNTKYDAKDNGNPTFIDLDKPWPNPVFTVVVWGDVRDRFATPPEDWHGRLCVVGRIRSYRGVSEIEVENPSQILH